MSLWTTIKSWFKKGIEEVHNLIAKAINLLTPFAKEFLSKSVNSVLNSSTQILFDACQYVEAQGLPTSKEAQAAFRTYMQKKLGNTWSSLKESEMNLLEEIGLAIYKKIMNK